MPIRSTSELTRGDALQVLGGTCATNTEGYCSAGDLPESTRRAPGHGRVAHVVVHQHQLQGQANVAHEGRVPEDLVGGVGRCKLLLRRQGEAWGNHTPPTDPKPAPKVQAYLRAPEKANSNFACAH